MVNPCEYCRSGGMPTKLEPADDHPKVYKLLLPDASMDPTGKLRPDPDKPQQVIVERPDERRVGATEKDWVPSFVGDRKPLMFFRNRDTSRPW